MSNSGKKRKIHDETIYYNNKKQKIYCVHEEYKKMKRLIMIYL